MDSRRDFLRKAAILTGGIGISATVPSPIQKAMLINPNPGTTYLDAEHIVFLMQENRSFDHVFGTLKGVRGFNDPRAKTLPNQNKVWLQNDTKGNTFIPFRLDLKQTKITWQGGLPHGWEDQLGANNKGKHDQWIPYKTPMCMGHYTREDLPFYYALADAFTVCDHSFCSSLTGTTPNRLFFWTGTNRTKQTADCEVVVNNHQAESRHNTYVDWETFPELLEDNAVSWKVYQNELWSPDWKDEIMDEWLGNYGDNPLEYVKRYNVKLSAYFRKNGDKTNETHLSPEQVLEKYNQLSPREKSLLDKAFTTNIDNPEDYIELAPFQFRDETGNEQEVLIPKHDIFYQFRKDVDEGNLPTVSWLVAPQKFSDHTDSPLYGTWYVSEAMNILTKNPEVWKKTIFVLTYDENDGYFDHIPPFLPPKTGENRIGKVSEGIDTSLDFEPKKGANVGLGFRIPMIVASPWSRGGYVNSQIFDHTSSLMFLEKFLSHKKNKEIKCKTISPWRRIICGDLTSVFRPYTGEEQEDLTKENRESVITNIQKAKYKPVQNDGIPLTKNELILANKHIPYSESSFLKFPVQEKGVKKACSLPYQFYIDGNIVKDNHLFRIDFTCPKEMIGGRESVGTAFQVYSAKKYKGENGIAWPITIKAGDSFSEEWDVQKFENNSYDLSVSGPNGFFRQFKGDENDPYLKIKVFHEKAGLFKSRNSGNILVEIENSNTIPYSVIIEDVSYKTGFKTLEKIDKLSKKKLVIPLDERHNWYDFSIVIEGSKAFFKRYAGHVETGKESFTDPLMGGIN